MEDMTVSLNGVDITKAMKKLKVNSDKKIIKKEKVLAKFIKKYGIEAANAITDKGKEELEKSIADSTKEIEEARGELEANAAYQQAKADLKDLNGGFNEAVRPLKDAIKLATLLLIEQD